MNVSPQTLAALLLNATTGNRPPKITVPSDRLARTAATGSPLAMDVLPFSPLNGCYVQFSLFASLARFPCSNKESEKKRHNIELGDRPASQQGASSAPRSGRVSTVSVLSRAVFQFGLRQ